MRVAPTAHTRARCWHHAWSQCREWLGGEQLSGTASWQWQILASLRRADKLTTPPPGCQAASLEYLQTSCLFSLRVGASVGGDKERLPKGIKLSKNVVLCLAAVMETYFWIPLLFLPLVRCQLPEVNAGKNSLFLDVVHIQIFKWDCYECQRR